ncbi:MAG: hypothetical protein MJ208_04135 [Bacilli bacterium]|nr:hypothetical protein [Bacilli bacterium]
MRIFTDKRIKKQLIIMTIFFAFQELINVLIGTINTIMLGPTLEAHMAEKTISAVGFAFQIFVLLNAIMSALVYISNLFYSQHYGRGDIPQVEKDYYFCQKLSFLIGLLFMVLSIACPNQLIAIFAQGDQEVIEIGGEYLRIFGISFMFMPLSLMNYSLMKNTRLELKATICSIGTLSTIVILNSIFLYGLHIGPIGAALSITIARFLEFVVTTIIVKFKCVVKPNIKGVINPDFSRFKTSSKIMAPIFVAKIMWGLGVAASVIIIALFNDRELNAANQLMLLGQNLVNCFCEGNCVAIGIIVGRELGANRLIKVKETTHDLMKFCPIYGLILIGVFMLFLPFNWALNRNISETTLLYMILLFVIQAGMYIPRVYNCCIVNGILITGGDTRFSCIFDVSAYWVIIIPFSIISFKFGWHPLVPLILVQLEEGLKTPFFYYRYRQYKWINNLTHKKGIVFN